MDSQRHHSSPAASERSRNPRFVADADRRTAASAGRRFAADHVHHRSTTEHSEAGEIAAELALENVEGHAPSWFRGVAFTTLVLSVLTAAAALVAGMVAHETLLERTEEIIDLSAGESDVVSAEILQSKHDILTALGEPLNPDEAAFVEEMEAEAERLAAEGEAAEAAALDAASVHLVAAISATLFAVSIAVTGLAAVVRQRWLWSAGIGLGVIASVLLGFAVVGFFA